MNSFSVSFYAGKSDYAGDWGQSFTNFVNPNLHSGLGLNLYLNHRQFLTLSYSNGVWGQRSLDTNSMNRGFRMCVLNFNCQYWDSRYGKKLNPYLGGGIGVRFISGNFRTLQLADKPNFQTANMAIEPIIIITTGLSINLNTHLSFFIDLNFGSTFNDNLDGKSSKSLNFGIVDYHPLSSLGILYTPWPPDNCPRIFR